MNCHISGGSGKGWFVAAGTVYNLAGTATLPNTTVRLFSGSNGSGTLMNTIQVDNLGNFFTTQGIDYSKALYASVQGATGVKYMSSPITMGKCNSCHGVSTGKIWAQ